MAKTRQAIKKIVVQYKQILKTLGINAQKIILFGSYARGNPSEYSDIDLVVISKDFKNYNLRERLELLGVAAGKLFEPIEALGYTPEELEEEKKAHSFVGDIQNHACVEF